MYKKDNKNKKYSRSKISISSCLHVPLVRKSLCHTYPVFTCAQNGIPK